MNSSNLVEKSALAMPTLTVGVLTMNEEQRIASCVRSAAFADEVVVVDSGSTDRTIELAQNMGAKVYVHADWQGFAVQRNRLLAHSSGDYIFFLDADEEITAELQAQLREAVASGQNAVWRIQWSIVAFGKELKYFLSRTSVERLFRRDALTAFEGVVHEQALLHGGPLPRHTFRAKLRHYSRESVRGSLEKLTQYAMLGAAKRADAGKRGGILRGMASSCFMFVRLYVFRLGFLDGGAGFLFCYFVALECFFRYAALYYDRDTLTSTVKR